MNYGRTNAFDMTWIAFLSDPISCKIVFTHLNICFSPGRGNLTLNNFSRMNLPKTVQRWSLNTKLFLSFRNFSLTSLAFNVWMTLSALRHEDWNEETFTFNLHFSSHFSNLNYKINKTFNAKSASDVSPSSFFLLLCTAKTRPYVHP